MWLETLAFRAAGVVLVLLFPLAAAPGARAADDKVPEIESAAQAKPGEIALLKSPKGMSWFLRLPAPFDAKRGARLIVFLHGSNMNGLMYLNTFIGQGWCKADILACPNGETGEGPHGANNFTFSSAPYIAEITELLQKTFRVTRTFVGGHSQGGFLTYSVIMLYPQLYQGALPMAGDCWMQNEPNLWEEEPAKLARQREIAIAVIHGRSDPVVPFTQGQHAHDVFMVMGYPKLRLFAPAELGHQFALSPVEEALDWLDAMTGGDPKNGVRVAERAAEAKEWGWVFEASKSVIEQRGVQAGDRNKAKGLIEDAEREAKNDAKRVALAMEKLPAAEWLRDWWEFRRKFGGTRTAAPLVERYEKMRADQRQRGRKLFDEARGHLNAERTDEGHEVLRKILAEAPATYEAYYALEWLPKK